MSAAIELVDVCKRYGANRAVDGLSLEVPEGSLYGFIGPNGSGKTTTLRMMLGMIEPDTGEIRIFGKPGDCFRTGAMAYLPEERGLYRKMKVGAQLIYFGRLNGMSSREAKAAAKGWLERLDIVDRWQTKTESLSKGMTQKVQFVAAIIARPRLLILDEPFSGLDPVNLEIIRGIILELRDAGTTVILSTHDMATAEAMCERVLMIHRGKRIFDGSLAAIRECYRSNRVRLRMAEANGWHPSSLPAVEAVRATEQGWEICHRGSPQAILQAAVEAGEVELFERIHPSLHEIFVRAVTAGDPSESDGEEVRGV